MNAKYLALVLWLLAGGIATSSRAQSQSQSQSQSRSQVVESEVVPAQASFPYSSYGAGSHASTEAEGSASGMANIIQSAGSANLLHGQAARAYEEARALGLKNRLRATETYYGMKQFNREYTAALRGPRPTSEQMFRFAKERAPDRLSTHEFDPLTGRIAWPTVLEDDPYRRHRERLEELFSLWARYDGQIEPRQYLELQRSARAMQGELKRRIKQYPPADYLKAKNILESLAFEASRPAG